MAAGFFLLTGLLLLPAGEPDALETGTRLFGQGRFAEAAVHFERAVKAEPGSAQAWKALGAAWAAQGEHERAAEPFERACRLAPRLPDACWFHARNLYARNLFAPAVKVLREALPNERQPWRIHLALGQAAEALNQPEEAEREFGKAVALSAETRMNPDFDPRLHQTVFLFRQGRLQEALPAARAVTVRHPRFGRGHFQLGRTLVHLGDLHGAAKALEEAAACGYGAAAHRLLASVYLRLGRQADAERQLTLAAQAPPEDERD